MDQQTQENASSNFLKTDGGKTKSNAIEVPSISLPKGGGAIKGIDEKFSVNAVNGTAGFSIPLPFSEAREASPSLTLAYSSGGGNGIFGLGWNLSLGSIKRKTDKGLPQYLDAIDSDTFLFSEAEDLVPEFKKNNDGSFLMVDGEYVINDRNSTDNLFTIRNYKPRIEGLFARIERWTQKDNGSIKWRVISKENKTTLYGWSDNSIISNPEDGTKIYEWLPEFVFDDKGNCSHYIYKKEDGVGFNPALIHNKNRLKSGVITYTNLYLDKILYGNQTPYAQFGNPFPAEANYLFQTVFDYGTTNTDTEPFDRINPWDFRLDAFSNYKPGFEIRTTRLCKRVLLFHVFDELAIRPDRTDKKTLVKSLNFEYATAIEQDFTFLSKFTSFGYIKKPDGSYSHKHLPPMEFTYQAHDWSKEVKTVSSEELIHAPSGLDEKSYQFTDLFNEGLSGILTEQANGWYYKHNLGDGKFEHAKLVSPKPSLAGLGDQFQLADLDGDGGKQLVSYKSDTKGFFELDDDNQWHGLRSFKALPNIDFSDPNTRMLDLNGDGKAEVVISEEYVFTWYASEGRNGYAAARKTPKPFDEEDGPHIVFADSKQTIYLADMSGDGMTDILRIRNGEVCYWPNLGYGKFGAKVAVDNAPVFDHPDAFNPAHLRLADIDGSGTSDIIYLGKNKFTCWKNLSGNRFASVPFEIEHFPEIHSQAKITVTDLLGNGVACIVWSSSLSKDVNAPLKYIDLMNSKKPHIMVAYKNNLGKEVSMEYTPSTKFYIEDKLAGKPWVTKLHFPVHCLSKTTDEDKITGHKYVREYRYHHGYFDHEEREFRGFGMVEQIDAETFEHWVKQDATNITEEPLHQEPIVSKSWQHTGAFLRNKKILDQFENDYWYNEYEREFDPLVHHEEPLQEARIMVPEGMNPALIAQLSTDEIRDAYRACKGMPLRSETFAKDAVKFGNTEAARKKERTPFTVATNNCVIELIQPKGKNEHAVFAVTESESRTYSYERNPEDPRITHTLNIKLDQYGHVLESASVVYRRLNPDLSLPLETQQAQDKTVIVYTQNRFTRDVFGEHTHRLRLPSETRTFDLKGVTKAGAYYSISEFADVLLDTNSDTALYHELNRPLLAGRAQKRLIEHTRTLYLRNNLSEALPLHEMESLGITYESYQLAYTPELLTDIFEARVNAAMLTAGKFTDIGGDDNWWVRSGTITHDENNFYIPVRYTDPYGAVSKVKYYGTYNLFIEVMEDALGNKSAVERFNFRTLSPTRMRDINGNLSEAVSDELGLVKATAVMGKGSEADDLSGITDITTPEELATINRFFQAFDSNELTTIGKGLLNRASSRFVYDFEVYMRTRKPAVVAAINREHHAQEMIDSPVQIAMEYSSGSATVVMKKVQADPGKAKQVLLNPDNTITITEIDTADLLPQQLRWIGNGRIIKNNKDKEVKKYEPYFSVNWHYEDYKELVESGVTPKMYYDSSDRLIKTEMPDGTFSKVEFDSWKETVYDANDTILESSWFINRSRRLMDASLILEGKDPAREKIAADNAAKHAGTPTVMHYDTLGKLVLSIDHNRNSATEANEFYHTKALLDLEGNLRAVIDARNNTVMQYKYDMLGNLVYQNSMDAGQRWMLNNILGKPVRKWDERNHEFQYFYDQAKRPTHSKVIGGDGTTSLDHVFDKIIYGESLLSGVRTDVERLNEATLQARNILGQVIQHFDTAGVVDTANYDFKGQPIAMTRRLFRRYKEVANWVGDPTPHLEPGAGFTFSTLTDALGRISRQTAPDGSVITPSYNETGLFNGESVLHVDEMTPSVYIKNIDYNEKGLREKIIYGNDVSTKFYYDKETFRLKRLESNRLNGDKLQDWQYTYDPSGNVTHIEDRIAPIQFFRNSAIPALATYTYDALYRLVEATGRENSSALNYGTCDNWNDKPYMHSLNPSNPMAVRAYTQSYQYDSVGNILEMKHRADGGNWTRGYEYETTNNRLNRTFIGDNGSPANYTNYRHHARHGYMEELPHLEKIEWNFNEQVILTSRQRCTDDNIPVITYYQYNASGKRIRKITENQAAAGGTPTIKEERIYVSGFELYKKHTGTHAGLERVSLSLMDEGHRFVMVETRNDVNDGSEAKLVRYQLHNHLGSAALELDGTTEANVISYEEYHPFGTTAYQAVNSTIRSAAKRYRYTGMERDEETGLEYHSARYYLPWLGRWLSSDPIGIEDGVNVYCYCKNNPVVKSDKNGKQATSTDETLTIESRTSAWGQGSVSGDGTISGTLTGSTSLRLNGNLLGEARGGVAMQEIGNRRLIAGNAGLSLPNGISLGVNRLQMATDHAQSTHPWYNHVPLPVQANFSSTNTLHLNLTNPGASNLTGSSTLNLNIIYGLVSATATENHTIGLAQQTMNTHLGVNALGIPVLSANSNVTADAFGTGQFRGSYNYTMGIGNLPIAIGINLAAGLLFGASAGLAIPISYGVGNFSGNVREGVTNQFSFSVGWQGPHGPFANRTLARELASSAASVFGDPLSITPVLSALTWGGTLGYNNTEFSLGFGSASRLNESVGYRTLMAPFNALEALQPFKATEPGGWVLFFGVRSHF